jgi:6-phosphogluconate dehydrogenase
VTCSALRRQYRDILRGIEGPLLFAHLKGERAVIEQRMASRSNHFMPAELIESQFETLENTADEGDVIEIEINRSLGRQCSDIEQRLEAATIDFRLKPHLGLVGLGVMGSNLAANILENDFLLHAYDINQQLRDEFTNTFPSAEPCHGSLETLVAETVSPRCLLLLVKAGEPVDQLLKQLIPLLDRNDVIIDLGNSHYKDTDRRCLKAAISGIRYLGCGISGGADGARYGPALMPGGDYGAGNLMWAFFSDISAKHEGTPCVTWVGPQGAGHFVKMVHNGIEYADMQLIAEAYQIMRDGLRMEAAEIGEQFDQWNQGPLESYLIEATAKIFKATDEDGAPLIDRILDKAGQKGTGGWATETAIEFGVPATLMTEAVFARVLSSVKKVRQHYASAFGQLNDPDGVSKIQMLDQLEQGLYAAKVINYVQGFMLMAEVSSKRHWHMGLGNIAKIWRSGCIIRGQLLNDIMHAYENGVQHSLLDAPIFADLLLENHGAIRNVVKFSINQGIPVPAFSSAIAFFDSIRNAQGSANLIQAQRDYFGAHTFERVDQPEGDFFHADW